MTLFFFRVCSRRSETGEDLCSIICAGGGGEFSQDHVKPLQIVLLKWDPFHASLNLSSLPPTGDGRLSFILTLETASLG